jgi:hypothetical protein
MNDDELERICKEAVMAWSRYCVDICLEEMSKTMKTLVRVSGALADIRTEHRLNTSQERYLQTNPFGMKDVIVTYLKLLCCSSICMNY